MVERSALRHSAGLAVRVRPAGPADGDFLAEMLVAAFFWQSDGHQGDVQSVLGRPEVAHYVKGWPNSGVLAAAVGPRSDTPNGTDS